MGDVTPADEHLHYSVLLREAEAQRLNEPPPFATEDKRVAWRDGYMTALRDMAKGRLRG